MNAAVHSRPMLALILRLIAVAMAATVSAMMKVAYTNGVAFAEILFWRQFVSVPVVLLVAMFTGGIATLATPHRKRHAIRALYSMTAMVLAIGAVMLLPLAEATTLNFTVPIFAVIMAYFFYKEKVGVWRWSAVGLGFLGILVITQPGSQSDIPLFGAAVGLAGAIVIALTMFQVAELGRLEKPLVVVFWFALVSSPLFGIAAFFMHAPYGWSELLLLIAMGLIGGVGQLLHTFSLRFGSVASVLVMDYTALFWATIYGWTLFDELPATGTWLGAPLIVIAGLTIAWREHRLSRAKPGNPPAL